jgi:hypothetical protein
MLRQLEHDGADLAAEALERLAVDCKVTMARTYAEHLDRMEVVKTHFGR